MAKRRVLVTADQQCGSAVGLWPPDFKATYKPNVIQTYLWECWQDQAAHMPPLDVIVFLGEAVEGVNPKGDGDAICETSISKQVDAFIECAKLLLAKVRRGGSVYVMRTSQYHSGNAARSDQELGSKLHLLSGEGKRFRVIPEQHERWAHSWLHLDVEGVRFDLAHHRSSAQVNRSMPLERELRYNALVADLLQGGDDVIVRAHTHVDTIVNQGNKWAIGLPAWKCQDDFAARGFVPSRMLSEWIGSVLVTVDGDAKQRGDDPIVIRKYYYRHPQITRYYHQAAAPNPD